MTVHDQLRALCDVVDVPLDGLMDEELDIIAIRVAMEGEPTPTSIGRIVDQVRWQRPLIPCCEPATYAGPSGIRKRHAWGCVWAGQPVGGETHRNQVDEVAARRRLAETRKAEPEARRLKVHPACLAAHNDGGQPCSACSPLLHADDCDCYWCGYFSEYADGGS